MRLSFLTLFVTVGALAIAQQTSPSEQLKQKFIAILNDQLSKLVAAHASESPQLPADEIAKGVHAFTAKAAVVYAPLITLSDDDAHRLLTTGPNDEANMAAMQRDIELWRRVERPLPTLYKQMQDDVTNGEIKGGLELELTRRISEFHLRQLGLL
jgi:hypothetical protein